MQTLWGQSLWEKSDAGFVHKTSSKIWANIENMRELEANIKMCRECRQYSGRSKHEDGKGSKARFLTLTRWFCADGSMDVGRKMKRAFCEPQNVQHNPPLTLAQVRYWLYYICGWGTWNGNEKQICSVRCCRYHCLTWEYFCCQDNPKLSFRKM